MRRILFVHSGKGIGGAPLTLLTLIRMIDRSRFSPHVLCLFESEAADLFRKEGIDTYVGKGIHHLAHTTGVWYPVRYFPMLLYRLFLFPISIWNSYRFLRAHDFDYVHLNGSGLLAVAIAARLRRIPVLLHVLEHLHPGYIGLRRFVMARLLTKFSDAVVFICNSDARSFPPSAKLHVVYDSIDPGEFDPESVTSSSKSSFAIPDDARVVGMLGGISPIKGTLEFVEAAARVVQRFPNAHFLILGVPPARKSRSGLAGLIGSLRSWWSGEKKYRARVSAVAGRKPLSDNVHIAGPTLKIPPVVKMLDVLTFPSTTPHYARPLIEAGLMNKPVVASRIGGPDEIVADGITGFLVSPNNPEELAERIITLLDDPKLAGQMGRAGRAIALEKFDMRKNVPQILKLYDLIAKPDRK